MQFFTICQEELTIIRNTFIKNYNFVPKILYIIAQKRHLCRIAAKNDKNQIVNPPPGTVLDSTITGPENRDFYLIGHTAIKGSPKPIHYHVFHNDTGSSLDVIQDLLYRLCHLHPGCTRSVSLPIPLYNAHKLAYRVGQVYRAAHELREDTEGSDKEEETITITLPDHIKSTPFFL